MSAAAREKIEGAGGSVTLREVKRPEGPRFAAKEKAMAETTEAAPAKKKPAVKKSSATKTGAKKKSSAKS